MALLPLPAVSANTNVGQSSEKNGYSLPFLYMAGSDHLLQIDFSDQPKYGNSTFTKVDSECKAGNTCWLYMQGGHTPDFGSDLEITITVKPVDLVPKSTKVTLTPYDRYVCEKIHDGQLGVSLEYHQSIITHSMKADKYCYIKLFLP